MQQAQRLAAHDGLLGIAGFLARAVKGSGGHGIDVGVHVRDPGDAGVQQFDRRQLASADQAPQLDGIQGKQRGRSRHG